MRKYFGSRSVEKFSCKVVLKSLKNNWKQIAKNALRELKAFENFFFLFGNLKTMDFLCILQVTNPLYL